MADGKHGTSSSGMQPPAPGTVVGGSGEKDGTLSFNAERIIGNGSFGVVFQASVVETGEIVAIKKVLQDKRFKNRELHIMRQLMKAPHTNIVTLKHCFYSSGEKQDELYLNLVLEFVPETVYSVARQWQKSKQALPILQVKLCVFSRLVGRASPVGRRRLLTPLTPPPLPPPPSLQLHLSAVPSARAVARSRSMPP